MHSQTYNARYMRTRRLVDDEYAKRINESTRKSKAKRKLKQVKDDSMNRARLMRDAFAKRVQFHLSRGRDVGDIAVRENVPVSKVLSVINSNQ